jgi:hypothetical protein
MQPGELEIGDVVQIDPGVAIFGGTFMLVTSVRSWGAQGFIAMPARSGAPLARAYVRCRWESIEYVGPATWIPQDDLLAESAELE